MSRSSGASISIDRREAYYERAASLIAADPLGFYIRAEAGRQVQGNIKPKDLMQFTSAVAPKPDFAPNVVPLLKWKRA
jgi:hypothetical protein